MRYVNLTSYYMLRIELVDVLDEVSIVCHVAMLFCMLRLSVVFDDIHLFIIYIG